jgi:hypothetical protein
VVASAKRGVLGCFRDDVEEDESVDAERAGVKFKSWGRCLSTMMIVDSNEGREETSLHQ